MRSSDLIPSPARPGAPAAEELVRAAEASRVAGRTDEALRLLASAVRADGRSVAALTAFARALAKAGDRRRARVVLGQSLALDPVQRAAWLALAEVEVAERRADAALEALDRALALGPATADLLVVLGRARLGAGDLDGARRAAEHGLGQAPSDARMFALAAEVDRAAGEHRRAAHRLARAATLDPRGQSRAWYRLAAAGEPIDEAELRAELTRADADGDPERRADLHFALAQLLARAGDPAALDHAAIGNDLVPGAYDAAAHALRTRAIVATFDGTYFAQARGAGLRGSAPIFVVGAPGPARDHVAALLGAHPRLVTRDDPFFEELADEVEPAVGLPFPGGCERLQRAQWAGIAHRYVDSAGAAARGLRTVDAAPDLLPHLGAVANCLPDARVIHVAADRRDAALAAYLAHGGERPDPGAASFSDLVARRLDDEALIAHWRRTLPLPILAIDAVDLEREATIQHRRLLEFVGATIEGVGTVATPDLGIGRWRRFESELRAALPRHWFDTDPLRWGKISRKPATHRGGLGQ